MAALVWRKQITPDQERYLQKKADAGNAHALATLEDKAHPESFVMWEAFWRCRRGAKDSMSGERPIDVKEVLAYCQLIGISDVDQRVRMLDAIHAMDGEYFNGKA